MGPRAQRGKTVISTKFYVIMISMLVAALLAMSILTAKHDDEKAAEIKSERTARQDLQHRIDRLCDLTRIHNAQATAWASDPSRAELAKTMTVMLSGQLAICEGKP